MNKGAYTTPRVPQKCISLWGSRHCAGGWSLGTYGGGVDASSSGRVGYAVAGNFDAGQFQLKHPVNINIDPVYVQNRGSGPEKIHFKTSYKLGPGAGLDTRAGRVGLKLDALLDIQTKLAAKTCLGVSPCNTITPLDFKVDNARIPLVDISSDPGLNLRSSDLSGAAAATLNTVAASLLGGSHNAGILAGLLPDAGFRQLKIGSPNLDTHSSLVRGGSVSTVKRDDFFKLSWDVTKLAEMLGCNAYFKSKGVGRFNPVRALCPHFARSLGWGSGSIDYNLLKLVLDVGFGVEQRYDFSPVLMGSISSGSETQEFRVGDEFDLNIPGGGLLNLSTSYWLSGPLKVVSNFFVQPSLSVSALGFSARQVLPDRSFDLGNTSFSHRVKDGCKTWLPWPLDYLCDVYNYVTETASRAFGSVTAAIPDINIGPYGPLLNTSVGTRLALPGSYGGSFGQFNLGVRNIQVNTWQVRSVPNAPTLVLMFWGLLWLLYRRKAAPPGGGGVAAV